jgi:hypothetical protein
MAEPVIGAVLVILFFHPFGGTKNFWHNGFGHCNQGISGFDYFYVQN